MASEPRDEISKAHGIVMRHGFWRGFLGHRDHPRESSRRVDFTRAPGLLDSGAPLAYLDGGRQVIFYGRDDIVAEIRKLIECA